MMLLGITGHKRCGKGSAAQVLVQKCGFTEYGYADALRAMALAVNPAIELLDAPLALVRELQITTGMTTLPRVLRYSTVVKSLGYERAKDVPDFRGFLQRLGTEGVRGTFGPSAWVDVLMARIEHDFMHAPTPSTFRAVISDVRFFSEARAIEERHGRLWRMVRPGYENIDPHPSERDIPLLAVDCEIVAASLPELEAAVLKSAEASWHIHPNP